MTRKAYLELTNRQQEEFNNFPIAFAFNDEQVSRALEDLGAADISECVTVFGHGDIVKKEDAPKLKEMMIRHRRETREAMKDDQFAEAAFLYEMDNHEYAINWDGDVEVLEAVGLNVKLLKEMGLEAAYHRARLSHMKYAKECEMI